MRPPALADWILHRLLGSGAARDVVGDLHEEYARFKVRELGPARARLWYWHQALAAVAHCGRFRLALPLRAAPLLDAGDDAPPPPFVGLLADLRHSLRALGTAPGFSATAILTLAMGTGFTTVVFSAVHGVLLEPLPYERPQDLMVIGGVDPSLVVEHLPVSAADYRAIRTEAHTVVDVAAEWPTDANLTGDGPPARLAAALVSPNLFSVLGVPPAMGRDFRSDEGRGAVGYVAILSHRAWQRHFQGRPEILGEQVSIDGDAITIVGVMPEAFRDPGETPGQPVDAWIPVDLSEGAMYDCEGCRVFKLIGRKERDATFDESSAELQSIAARRMKAEPSLFSAEGAWTLSASPLFDDVVGEARTVLLLLFGSVAIVLLTMVTNLSNLQMTRGSARLRDFAVRAALGASRWRILRQQCVESVLLGLAGGGAGVGLAFLGNQAVEGLLSPNLPRWENVEIDGAVMAFAFGVSLISALVFGLAPAAGFSRTPARRLLEQAEGRSARGTHTARNVFIGIQTASSLVLLVGAGLLLKSYRALGSVDTGFQAERVLTLDTWLPIPNDPLRGRYTRPPERITLFSDVLDEMERLPGVAHVGVTSLLPLRGLYSYPVFVDVTSPDEDAGPHAVEYRIVSEGFFDALGIDVARGRTFERTDTLGGPRVAVVNKAFAHRYLRNSEALGRHLRPGSSARPSLEVVGIVADVSHVALGGPALPTVYHTFRQADRAAVTMTFVVKTTGPPESVAESATSALQRVDPELPAFAVASMESQMADARSAEKTLATLFALFGLLTLALSTMGIYGVVSYAVTRRAREIGIRLALGGARLGVLRMLVSEGLRLGLAGAAAGLVAALVLSPALEVTLFDVQPLDPAVFAAAAAAAIAMVTVASVIPAWAITKVNPQESINAN